MRIMFGYHKKLLRVDLTNRKIDVEDLDEQIILFNLKTIYNTRLGVSRKDDFLPYRYLTLKRTGEDLTNQLSPLGRLLSDCYAYRGWSEDGIPAPEKLKELRLDKL